MYAGKRVLIAALAAGLGVVVLATTPLMTRCASANDCAAKCQAAENACRRATKDSPACGQAMTRCLQGCRAQR